MGIMRKYLFQRIVPVFLLTAFLSLGGEDIQLLTGIQREAIVRIAAEELAAKYVFPETGEKMAARLMHNLKDGSYDSLSNPYLLAEHLEDDLFGICGDKHLHIIFKPVPEPAGIGKSPQVAVPGMENHGFKRLEIFPGSIGYMRLDGLSQGAEAELMASSALNFLSICRTLIIDLRENRGGAAWMVQYICSFLFQKRRLLYSLYHRPEDRTRDIWTLESDSIRRFRESVRVYVLIGPKTFSGAEGLAYVLKHHKRAVIIGETSAGGAHPMMWIRLGEGFEMSIPYMRVIHPFTQTDWEGTGVKPDYEVQAAEALELALNMARKSEAAIH